MQKFVIKYETTDGERLTREVEAESGRIAVKSLYDVQEIMWIKTPDEIKPRKKRSKPVKPKAVYNQRSATDFIRRIREGNLYRKVVLP